MRGPPITIRCECGEVRDVPYGERWRCEVCRRSWNTSQIPAEEYWDLMREMRRLRFSVIGVALGISLVFGLLGLLLQAGPPQEENGK